MGERVRLTAAQERLLVSLVEAGGTRQLATTAEWRSAGVLAKQSLAVRWKNYQGRFAARTMDGRAYLRDRERERRENEG